MYQFISVKIRSYKLQVGGTTSFASPVHDFGVACNRLGIPSHSAALLIAASVYAATFGLLFQCFLTDRFLHANDGALTEACVHYISHGNLR